jgi:hypothetical protein
MLTTGGFRGGDELFLGTELPQQGYESYAALKRPGFGTLGPILKLTNG